MGGNGGFGQRRLHAAGDERSHAAAGLLVFSNAISGNGNLQKGGNYPLTLLGANTYTGNTTISGGTLALSGSGSIANSATISVAANATLDVSTLTTALTLDSSQTLKAGGSGGASAIIATASGKGLTLGATSGLQFTAYDGSTVPLTVTGSGSLTLAAGNPVHVVINHGGTPLGAGDYQLISTGTGASIAGSEPSSVVVNDPGSDGIASGLAASLRINSPGPGLYLHVQRPLHPARRRSGLAREPGGLRRQSRDVHRECQRDRSFALPVAQGGRATSAPIAAATRFLRWRREMPAATNAR